MELQDLHHHAILIIFQDSYLKPLLIYDGTLWKNLTHFLLLPRILSSAPPSHDIVTTFFFDLVKTTHDLTELL